MSSVPEASDQSWAGSSETSGAVWQDENREPTVDPGTRVISDLRVIGDLDKNHLMQ